MCDIFTDDIGKPIIVVGGVEAKEDWDEAGSGGEE
jgi:hypothetical protein